MHAEVDGIRTRCKAQVLSRVAAATREFAVRGLYGNPVERVVVWERDSQAEMSPSGTRILADRFGRRSA